MEFSNALSNTELDELNDFLISDETLEGCMDISTLDGFLTALIIGPDTIVPSRWLPVLWGETENDEMVWESMDKMEPITSLILRHYNSIAEGFQVDPPDFNPIIYISGEEEEVAIIDEWCHGFMQAVGLSFDSWKPIIDSDEHRRLITPILLHGTAEGWEELAEDPQFSAFSHEEWVAMLPAAVREIHQFWIPYRRAEAQIAKKTSIPKTGRNDPCPCGSGKKYKKCCGASWALD